MTWDTEIDQCSQCRDYFLGAVLIQAEVTFEIAKFGEKAGHTLMLEIMEPIHEGHDDN